MDVVLVVGIVQHRVELDFVDLGDRADVARNQGVGLDIFFSLQQIQVRHLERPRAVADEQLRIALHRALVHAENAELAHVGIDDDLEHVGEHVLGRVGLGVEFDRVRAFALEEGRRVALRGVGRELREYVEQFGDACAVPGRDEAHRYQVAFAQRLLERRVQLFRLRSRPARGRAPSAPRRPPPPDRPAPRAPPSPRRNPIRRRG